MRVVETFTKGGFPKLVLESKRDFASKYGLQAEYWQHNKPEELPEALAYLKTDLKDLATHYHAEYQSSQDANVKLANYHEAHVGMATTSSPSRRTRSHRRSTTGSRTFSSRTRTSARRPNSTSARPMNTRQTLSRQPLVTPQFTHIASS